MKALFKKAGAVAGIGAMFALSIVATANAAPPAPTNIDPDATGSITLTKYSGEAVASQNTPGTSTSVDNDPLAGVSFTAYRVDGLDVTDPSDWPAITELNSYVVAQGTNGQWSTGGTTLDSYDLTEVSEETTDGNGVASWGVGTPSTLPLGVYLIEETGAPAHVAEHTLPFLVTVPLANNTDGSWIYDVNVYPKNATTDINKSVTDPGTVGIGSLLSWTIEADIPSAAQRNLESFVIMDVLDSRLTYEADSLVGTIQAAGTSLIETTDYTYTVGTVGISPNTLKIVFTPAGLAKLDAANANSTVRLAFDTRVTSLGETGVIENSAEVWVNDPTAVGDLVPGTGHPSPKVTSKWGAVEIYKYNAQGSAATDRPLANAVFQVFGTEAEAQTCATAVRAPAFDPTVGCANAISAPANAVAGTVSNKFTTGTDGYVTIPGLNVGTINYDEQGDPVDNYPTGRPYYLVEIVAPAGFLLPAVDNAVIDVTVTNSGTALVPVEVEVPNAQESPSTLPLTGAEVTRILVIAAAVLVVGAVIVVAVNRRKAAMDA